MIKSKIVTLVLKRSKIMILYKYKTENMPKILLNSLINKKVIIKILKLAQEHFRSMMYIGNLFKERWNKIDGLDTKVVKVFQCNKS